MRPVARHWHSFWLAVLLLVAAISLALHTRQTVHLDQARSVNTILASSQAGWLDLGRPEVRAVLALDRESNARLRHEQQLDRLIRAFGLVLVGIGLLQVWIVIRTEPALDRDRLASC